MTASTAETATRRPEWQRRFRVFWFGETVSLVGSQVTVLALPLVAIVELHASAIQVGVLGMARYAPTWLLGLPVGAWVDRHRRRPALIAANLGRVVLLVAVPILWATGSLTFTLLLAAALGAGAGNVLYQTAYPAFVPTLVPTAYLVTANGRLVTSASLAEVGGPGLGGVLVGALGPATALIADAVSYVVSAMTLAAVRVDEEVEHDRLKLWPRIREGLRATFGDRYLRPICLQAGVYNMWEAAMLIVFLLYGVRDVGLSAQSVGLVLSVGALGAVVGATLAARVMRSLGFGPALIAATVLGCASPILLPLAPSRPTALLIVGSVGLMLSGTGIAASSVYVITLRQRLLSSDLMGRATAGYQLVSYGGIPLGSLLGGVLASRLGGRGALTVIALGLLTTPLVTYFSPLRTLRTLPAEPPTSALPHRAEIGPLKNFHRRDSEAPERRDR